MAAGAGVLPRELPLRVFTGAAIASAATLLAAVIWLAEPDPPVDGRTDVVRVGVVEGQSVPGYVDSSRGELAALAAAPGVTDTWALVSLRGYLAPGDLLPVLGGVGVAQVYARAPMAGDRSPVERIPVYRMPEDVVAGMLGAAVRRDQERADYEQFSRQLREGQERLRHAYAAAARLAADEARAYRTACACVFAAVVRAAPAVLAQIAGRAAVRAVDPAPEVRRLDRAEFRPPLPEQRTTVPEATATPPATTRPEASAAPPRTTRNATVPARADASTVAPAVSAPLPSSSGIRKRSASVPSTPASALGDGRLRVPAATADWSGR